MPYNASLNRQPFRHKSQPKFPFQVYKQHIKNDSIKFFSALRNLINGRINFSNVQKQHQTKSGCKNYSELMPETKFCGFI